MQLDQVETRYERFMSYYQEPTIHIDFYVELQAQFNVSRGDAKIPTAKMM